MSLASIPNLRDIPNLDDRLVRFLEQLNNNVHQLLELHRQNKDRIDANVNPTIEAIRAQLEANGSSPLNIVGLLPSDSLTSPLAKEVAGAPYANDGFIEVSDQQGNLVKVMTTV